MLMLLCARSHKPHKGSLYTLYHYPHLSSPSRCPLEEELVPLCGTIITPALLRFRDATQLAETDSWFQYAA